MAAGNKLFDQIQNLYEKDTVVTTETKPESIYMTNRFLSLSIRGFLAASECNESKMPEWAKMPFLYYSIKKQPRPRITYPKAETITISARRKRAIQRVCDKFGVKEYHGIQILMLLEQQGFKIESD